MRFMPIIDEHRGRFCGVRDRLPLATDKTMQPGLLLSNFLGESIQGGLFTFEVRVDLVDQRLDFRHLISCYSRHNLHNTDMPQSFATMVTSPATEREIRDRLLAWLTGGDVANGIVSEEFPLHTDGARIDVVQLGTEFVGYEIKSDQDTFDRLAKQLHAYNRVFDRLYLVCGPRHIAQALALLPPWWGILRATRGMDSAVELQTVRAAMLNIRQEAFSLASLLWRDEALTVLKSANITTPKKASSHLLWEQLAISVPMDALRLAVMGLLIQRPRYSAAAVSTM